MDYKQIQSIIKNFENSTLTSLEIESEGFKLKLSKNKNEVIVSTPTPCVCNETQPDTIEEENLHEVKSPLVGTFYTADKPDNEPFVIVGQPVKVGDTLCIIEAMKIMNEITAQVSGTIKAINAKNGSAVGYDQVLMVIE
jgi:acetyl-CoA carboxylase biotin carboxyl carrier protein